MVTYRKGVNCPTAAEETNKLAPADSPGLYWAADPRHVLAHSVDLTRLSTKKAQKGVLEPRTQVTKKRAHDVTTPQTKPNSRGIYLGYDPRSYFKPFHMRQQRFSCIVAHRRAGKTVAAIMDTVHRALKDQSGTAQYAFCGPTHAQIKDVVWQYLKQFTYPLPNSKVNEAEMSVKLFNGSRIRLYSLDSTAYDRMRGIYLDGCTIDEYEDCDPRALTEVIRPALADRLGWLSVIGTVKGRGPLYKMYREASKDPASWYVAKIKASETDAIHHGELEQMKAQMGENEYARELECDFSVEGHDQFVSGLDIEEAFQRSTPTDPEAPVTMGVDVARFGDDRSVLVVREGQRLVFGKVWRNRDLMFTAAEVAQQMEVFKPRMVFVDGIGVGGGVIDRLRHLGHTNVEDVNVGRKANDERKYTNHRAECYARLKDWLTSSGSIHDNFSHAKEFEDDLTSLSYTFDSRGRFQLESKDVLKSKGLPSPDVADAVSLTFSQILPTYDVTRSGRLGRGPKAYIAPLPDLLDDWG